MAITTFYNGHNIFWNNGKWYYQDGTEAKEYKPCPKCGQLPTKEGHDYCLANLPGVKNACCGHGVTDGYIQFENGITIRMEIKSIENDLTTKSRI